MFKRIFILGALALAVTVQAATVIPSTSFTRDFMRSTDAAAARAKIGVDTNGVPAGFYSTITTLSNRQSYQFDDFGGRPDGRKIYGYTISSGTVTVPGGQFAATDTNKLFVGYQDVTNRTYFLARITNYISATQIKLNTNLTIATTNEGFFGTDNQPALSNLVNTVRGDAAIFFASSNYLFNGLFASSNGGYTTIQLPAPAAFTGTNYWRTIRFVGASPAVVYPQTLTNASLSIGYPWSGTILFNVAKMPNTALTNSFFESYGNGPFGGFAMHSVYFENMTFRYPPNEPLTTWNFKRGGYRESSHCSIDADPPPGYFDSNGHPIYFPPTNRIAVIGPDIYNFAGQRDYNLTVSYQGTAYRATEHTILSGRFSMVGCNDGLKLDAEPGLSGVHVDALIVYLVQSKPIFSSGSGVWQKINIGLISMEQHSAYPARIFDAGQKLHLSLGQVHSDSAVTIDSTNLSALVMHTSNNADVWAQLNRIKGYSWEGMNNRVISAGNTNERTAGAIAGGYPYAKTSVGDASNTKPGSWFTPITDAGVPIYFAVSSKNNFVNATARNISLEVVPASMEGRLVLGTAGNVAAGPMNFHVDLDGYVPGSIDFTVNTNGYSATMGNGGHLAASFITSTRSTPPSFAETSSVTNRVIQWWSNSIPPVLFYSVYYANNTSTPKTTNAPNPLPGP